MSKRTPKGHFAPGHSGNPGGRPGKLSALRELAQANSAEAIELLVSIMRSDRAPAAARLAAANAILDRAVGKPGVALPERDEPKEQIEEDSVQTLDEFLEGVRQLAAHDARDDE